MDSSTIKLGLTGEFTASELDEIIRDLAEARAALTPEVSRTLPSPTGEVQVLVEDETLFKVATRVGGGMRIWLRNSGLGWMAFNLSPADVLSIRELLAKEIASPPGAH